MTTTRRRVLAAGSAAAVLVLVIIFGRTVSWHAALSAIRGADVRLLLLAVALNLLSLACKGVRWWVLLVPAGVRSLALVLRATCAGAALNNLVVAQGGEGARIAFVSRASGVSALRVGSALAIERTLDLASYLVLLVSAGWLLGLPPALARWRTPATLLLCAAILGIATYTWLGRRRPSMKPERRTFAPSAARIGAASVLSLAAWALQVCTYHLVAVACGLALPLAGSVAAQLAIGVSFLVRATPGNVGIFQVVYALTVARYGVSESPAVAVALLIQLVQLLPVLAIGAALTPSLVALRAAPDAPGVASIQPRRTHER